MLQYVEAKNDEFMFEVEVLMIEVINDLSFSLPSLRVVNTHQLGKMTYKFRGNTQSITMGLTLSLKHRVCKAGLAGKRC